MKITCIVGSSNEDGNTEIAINHLSKRLEYHNAEVTIIKLSEKEINDCTNCDICKSDICPIKDDVSDIFDTMLKSDIIVIGSPVYFGDISGKLKCLIDRSIEIKRNGFLFENKIGAAIAVGGVWGHSRALETIIHHFAGHSMISVSTRIQPGIGIQIFAGEKGELLEKKEELIKLGKFADRIIEFKRFFNEQRVDI